MTERIDHVAVARRLQGGARDIVRAINGDPAFQPHMAAIIMLDDARLEVQLALVEQQRIANIIAAGEHRDTVISALIRTEQPLRPEIAAALGLTAGQEGEAQ